MTTWIIKSETDDPERALKIVADQRTKGYTAWIEDERGKAVDEESLRKNESCTFQTLCSREVARTTCRFWIGYGRSRYFVRDWFVGRPLVFCLSQQGWQLGDVRCNPSRIVLHVLRDKRESKTSGNGKCEIAQQ